MDNARRPVRVTSFDVAERAGVSQSTVSRALSGSAVISEATRNRVLEVASELGYFVDERAARLRRGHTGTLAAVVITMPGGSARDVNPFSYALLGGICAAAAERGLEVLVSLQGEEEKLFGHYVERGQAEGLIVIGTTLNRPAWDYFRGIGETSEPVAYWGSPTGDLDWVSSDNEAGARMAAEHLVEAGCKSLVCVGSRSGTQRQFGERADAFLARAEELGVNARLAQFGDEDDRHDQGVAVGERLLGEGEVDGVFAVCDALAFGVLEAFNAAGRKVPGDIKLIGFDGLQAGELSNPPLTTIEPDLDQAGRLLVEAVTAGGPHSGIRRVPVKLLKRASV